MGDINPKKLEVLLKLYNFGKPIHYMELNRQGLLGEASKLSETELVCRIQNPEREEDDRLEFQISAKGRAYVTDMLIFLYDNYINLLH